MPLQYTITLTFRWPRLTYSMGINSCAQYRIFPTLHTIKGVRSLTLNAIVHQMREELRRHSSGPRYLMERSPRPVAVVAALVLVLLFVVPQLRSLCERCLYW